MSYNYYHDADTIEASDFGPLLPGAEWADYEAAPEWAGDALVLDALALAEDAPLAPVRIARWRSAAGGFALLALAVGGALLMDVRPALGVGDEVMYWLIVAQVATFVTAGVLRMTARRVG